MTKLNNKDEYNTFFYVIAIFFLYISLRRVYFVTCFGRKGPSSGYLQSLFLHQPHSVSLLRLLQWPMFTLKEVEGDVCPFVSVLTNGELLK
jgi:hypothetical protein